MEQASNNSKRVLIFNPLKRLVNVAQSAFAIAKANDWSVSSIRAACSGAMISYRKLYFRYLDDNIEISMEDLGTLTLEDYDKLCGIERKMYKDKTMSRNDMKYNKRPKERSPYYPFKKPMTNES